MSININEIYKKLMSQKEAEAIALGGSRASGNDDPKSDYDIYVYVSDMIDISAREDILKPYCLVTEIGNHYFEPEDNVVFTDGVCADIIYRKIGDLEKHVEYVWEKHNASNGYTTCFIHNIRTCDIIADKTGRLTKLQERCSGDYPQELKKAIIERNINLLSDTLPSYDKQITKAYDRHDFVSINHRVTAFLESYFDVIFAINEMTHPGEKKLIQICKKQCGILPDKFESNIIMLLEYMFKYDVSDITESMVKELRRIIE